MSGNKLALSPCPAQTSRKDLAQRSGLMINSECNWPKCSCPLDEISGYYHQEKIQWLVNEKIKDPTFKIPKIVIHSIK